MHKLFGVIFLAASLAAGFASWHIWRDIGTQNTNLLLLPGLALACLFLLVVGVKFMLGRNPVKEMWLQSVDDD